MTTRLELRRRWDSLDPFVAYPLVRRLRRWLHLKHFARDSILKTTESVRQTAYQTEAIHKAQWGCPLHDSNPKQ